MTLLSQGKKARKDKKKRQSVIAEQEQPASVDEPKPELAGGKGHAYTSRRDPTPSPVRKSLLSLHRPGN